MLCRNNESLAASEGLGSLPVARSHNGSSDRAITQAVAASRQRNVDQDVIEIPDSPVDLRTQVVPSPVPSIDLGEFENFEEEDIFNDEEATIEPALPSEMETEHDVGLEWEQDFKEPDFELDRDFEAIYDQEVDFDDETHVEQGPDLPGKQGPDVPGKQNLQICLEKERIIKANTAVQPSSKGVTGQGNIWWVMEGAFLSLPPFLSLPFFVTLPLSLSSPSLSLHLPLLSSLFLSFSHPHPHI